MNWLRSLLVLALVLVLTGGADAADKAKKKKKDGKPAKGTVVEVKKDENKESGSLVVKVVVGKKKDGKTEEKTFKVSESTKVEKLQGKPKKGTPAAGTAAKFSEVAKGGNVILTTKGDEVTELKIVAGKKKKKNK